MSCWKRLLVLCAVAFAASEAGVVHGNGLVEQEQEQHYNSGGLMGTGLKFLADAGIITAEDLQVYLTAGRQSRSGK